MTQDKPGISRLTRILIERQHEKLSQELFRNLYRAIELGMAMAKEQKWTKIQVHDGIVVPLMMQCREKLAQWESAGKRGIFIDIDPEFQVELLLRKAPRQRRPRK